MMNLACALAQRECEGPLWLMPHRLLGAKTAFVSAPPPGAPGVRERDDGAQQQLGHSHGEQVDWRLYRATPARHMMLANSSFASRFHLAKRLEAHRGCVNAIEWNADGTLLITGSDDCKVNIYSSGPRYKLLHHLRTDHSRNIFCAKFVPNTNDTAVVSCGMDGEIRHTQIDADTNVSVIYSSPMHMVLKMSFLPGSSSVFLSTHQDGTVRLFDLRMRENNPEKILVDLRNARTSSDPVAGLAVNALAMCPLGSYRFALACGDPLVRLYDIRKLGTESTSGQEASAKDPCIARYCPMSVLEHHSKSERYGINVTGVDFNELGEIAATYSRAEAYVFSTNPLRHHPPLNAETAPDIDSVYYDVQTGYEQVFKGHRNVRTFLKEIAFLGGNEYVTTGSDCGHAFIWHKKTGRLVNMLKADNSVVNGVAPHPTLPYLATCGIDSNGKIWEPGDEYTFDSGEAEKVMEHNEGDGDEDEGVRISLLNLFNFLTMLRAREVGQHRDQERPPTDGEGTLNEAEEESEEEEEEDETTAQFVMDLEMVSVADEIRTKGNRLFKDEDYDGAEAEYSRALEHLSALQSRYDEVQRRRQRSRLLCLLNRAACNLKRRQWQQVVDDASEVLRVQPANMKALFRRAKALLELKQYSRALRDVLLAEQLSPGNDEISALHEQLRQAQAASADGMDVEHPGTDGEDQQGQPAPREEGGEDRMHE